VEGDRRIDGRQVEAEAAGVDGKELGKESESIASGGLEGHWDHWERQPRDGETDREMEDEMMGMRVKIIEGMQTCISSNIEPERKVVVVVVMWREGEGRRVDWG
jgi:hypothetical protein